VQRAREGLERRCVGTERAVRYPAPPIVHGEGGEPKRVERRDGGAGRLGAVPCRLLPGDEPLAVGGGGEPAAPLAIGEELLGGPGERDGGLEPARLEGGLVEVQEPLRQECVVRQEAEDARGPALRKGAQQPPIRPEGVEDEGGAPRRGLHPALFTEDPPAEGEGRDGQAVPRSDHLLIPLGWNSAATHREQPRSLPRERLPLHLVRRHDVEDVGPAQVPGLGDAVEGLEARRVGPEDAPDLRGRPDELATLHPFGVGVGGRVEAPLGGRQCGQQIVERGADDAREVGAAGDLPALRVGDGQERVVVERLLEVWDPPGVVCRVAVESTGELVVNSTRRHRLQRPRRHLQCLRVARAAVVAEQRPDREAGRELRRAGLPAMALVVAFGAAAKGHLEHLRARRRTGALARTLQHHADRLGEPRRDGLHPPRRLLPGLRDVPEDREEAAQDAPVSIARRKIGAGEEWAPLVIEPDAHRPAPAAGERLRRRHVDGVDVGPLLAVHLDRDEPLVEERGDLRVLERLLRHHVAPVAGGVAYGEEDGAPRPACDLERLVSPRVPVDRVLRVLPEIGARLGAEPIGCHAQPPTPLP
jgi:hypothetical protein